MRNIEIKARCADPDRARRRATDLGARYGGLFHQVDTYYRVPDGRLKLREAETAELIFYRRADQSGPKGSDYLVAPVVIPGAVNDLLSQALGAWARAEKTRELYLLDNVRIHLDEVAGLGSYIEVEVVVDATRLSAAELPV